MAEPMKVKKEPALPIGKYLWLILAIAATLYLVSGAVGYWRPLIGILTVFSWFKFIRSWGSLFSGLSSGRPYSRLVAWVEQNTPAKFDGSQPPEEVEGHLEAKLADLKKQGLSEKSISSLKWFVESRKYHDLVKKN